MEKVLVTPQSVNILDRLASLCDTSCLVDIVGADDIGETGGFLGIVDGRGR